MPFLDVFANVLRNHADGTSREALEMLNKSILPLAKSGAIPDQYIELFAPFGFDGNQFDKDRKIDVKSLRDECQSSRDSAVMQVNIQGFIEKSRAEKRPMPLSDMASIVALPHLRREVQSLLQVTEEVALKEMENRSRGLTNAFRHLSNFWSVRRLSSNHLFQLASARLKTKRAGRRRQRL